MARIIGPKCRICRRLGTKLFLKGARCETPKCAVEKRAKVPGQHGDKRSRLTDFGIHLRETQRAKKQYGLLDRQFKRCFEEALRAPGNTGEYFLVLLERRLDNVLYRLGFAASRAQARQVVNHGHVCVNGRRVTIPSYWVEAGDVITPAGRDRSRKLIQESVEVRKGADLPSWLSRRESPLEGRVVQIPARSDIAVPLDEQLIVEFCSR
jgi:small subunit ribosomal protein S4